MVCPVAMYSVPSAGITIVRCKYSRELLQVCCTVKRAVSIIQNMIESDNFHS